MPAGVCIPANTFGSQACMRYLALPPQQRSDLIMVSETPAIWIGHNHDDQAYSPTSAMLRRVQASELC